MSASKTQELFAEHFLLTVDRDGEQGHHVHIARGQLAKSILVNAGHRRILVVMKGGLSIDNRKFRTAFGKRAAMLSASVVELATGFPADAISPIGLSCNVPVYLDISLQAFSWIYLPADKSGKVQRISLGRLAELFSGRWVDVTKEACNHAA
jgi:prolyl-tRNA editing enzyme YbaK/EbsC (Cys-tRNA(Pro) deacylase)